MSEQIFKKSLPYRLSAYLLLLPFVPAVRPILNKYETEDLVIFITGLLLTVILIIYSNNKPYIRVTEKNIFIYLIHHHKPEIHYISNIERISIRNKKKIILYTEAFDPLEIRLNKKEQIRIITLMESKEIPISKAYRN